MKNVDRYSISGAEVKEHDNGSLIVGFSSQKISDKQLLELKKIGEDYFLAFYGCDFSLCNLDILSQQNVKQVGVFYSIFDDSHLKALGRSSSLRLLKLVDTLVSPECIDRIQGEHPDLKIYTRSSGQTTF